jgi:hypothetical protein
MDFGEDSAGKYHLTPTGDKIYTTAQVPPAPVTKTRNRPGRFDSEPLKRWSRALCPAITMLILMVLTVLSAPVIKIFYFMKFPVTVGEVNGSILLGMWGYCFKNVPNNGLGTSITPYQCHSLTTPMSGYTLSEFKFLLFH